jgi:hypothetical protein
MQFTTFETKTGPIVINTDHIIFFRPHPRNVEHTLIEITNPTPDEVGYVIVLHNLYHVTQAVTGQE